MPHKVVYREMTGFNEFEECYRLQKDVFNLSDKDVLPPVFINLLTRKYPKTGIALGAFIEENNNSRLIGYALCVKADNDGSLYGMTFGVLPEFIKQGIGAKILNSLREHSLAQGIKRFFCIYESLEGNLGNLYLDKFGMVGIKYEKEAYELNSNTIPIDKILMKWDFESQRVREKINKTYSKFSFNEAISIAPIVKDQFINSEKVLINIPDDFLNIKAKNKDEALEWRLSTRLLFDEYINNRNYKLTEFYTQMDKDGRKNYYLLEKASMN